MWESENRAGHKPVLHFPFSSLAEGFAQLLVNAEQLRVCSTQRLCWRRLWKSESPGDSALSQTFLSFEVSLLHAVVKSPLYSENSEEGSETPSLLDIILCRQLFLVCGIEGASIPFMKSYSWEWLSD